ncbi:MAG: hypothetical protein NTX21_09195 [Alphaproteobacteria bacterium]|nr:hypothetical protein [Alphaproteobacteria bacterium]
MPGKSHPTQGTTPSPAPLNAHLNLVQARPAVAKVLHMEGLHPA